MGTVNIFPFNPERPVLVAPISKYTDVRVRRGKHFCSLWTGTLYHCLLGGGVGDWGAGGNLEHRNVNIGSTCQASVICTGEGRLLACIYCTLRFPVEAYLFISPTLLVRGVAGCILAFRHSIGLLGG